MTAPCPDLYPTPATSQQAGATPILLFPGQSAFRQELLEVALSLDHDVTLPLIRAASERLGRDLRDELARAGDTPTNCQIQVSVFLASHLRLVILRAAGLPPGLSAGMSLGEYNHLVDIGALGFLDALALVDQRGRCYDAGPAGVMAALFPVDAETVAEAIAALGGEVWVSNDNAPTQQVVAGERDAVLALAAHLDQACFVEARLIEGRVPMHSPRFAPVAAAFRPHLDDSPFAAPARPYLSNVLGAPVEGAGPEAIRALLERHVSEPVRWRETVDWLAARHPNALFVEVGPGRTLTGLLRRDWRPEPRLDTDSPEAMAAALRALGLSEVGR